MPQMHLKHGNVLTPRLRFIERPKGFTLVELLVVIGILAVLLASTLIAINPGRQFQQANNTKRGRDVNTILNAINQYMSDNNGSIPAGVTDTVQEISNTGADICALLVPRYIAALAVDPLTNGGAEITNCSGAYRTNYNVAKVSLEGRITVSAPKAELGEAILVTR